MNFDIVNNNCNLNCPTREFVHRLICALIDAKERCARTGANEIVKPRNLRLLHALAVCELSRNRFAFLRTQLRSLNRSIKQLSYSEDVEPVVIYRNDYVPNAVNVLNKIKEFLPEDVFTSKNNKIQFVKPCDRRLLVDILSAVMHSRRCNDVDNANSDQFEILKVI
ncbi:BRO [Orgyia pseudotsugata single capsid nuclopolyhedrovirus]|nr:BRO [Orgyia pseudotsugata single capsid nuclopolyhedrovirus]